MLTRCHSDLQKILARGEFGNRNAGNAGISAPKKRTLALTF